MLGTGQVVRQAYVDYYGSIDPAKARRLWADHPGVSFKDDLNEIARASASGRKAPRRRIQEILERSARAPLAVEPFLVRGIEADMAGRLELAGEAFRAAKRRDPRSVAARYFLAEHYLKTEQVDRGLNELAVLTKLVPNSLPSVAPYYAAFAKSPEGAAATKAMLRSHPDFEASILAALATDAGNAELIMHLANQRTRTSEQPAWHGQIVQSLIASGQYHKARVIWAQLGGVDDDNLLFDRSFTHLPSIAPFGWTLTSSGAGTAEPEDNGRLHIIYYGREDIVLASQMVLLKPGRYSLSARTEAETDATSLNWKVTCRPSNRVILERRFGKAGLGVRQFVVFEVPRNCPAQMLELVGKAPEFPETADLTLSNLSLARVGQ
jgi:hypothetical protein